MRYYITELDNAPYIARYKLMTILRKLNVAVEYVMCKESLAGIDPDGNMRWIFEYKLK